MKTKKNMTKRALALLLALVMCLGMACTSALADEAAKPQTATAEGEGLNVGNPTNEEDPANVEDPTDEEDPTGEEDPTDEEDPTGEEDPADEEDPTGEEDPADEEDPTGDLSIGELTIDKLTGELTVNGVGLELDSLTIPSGEDGIATASEDGNETEGTVLVKWLKNHYNTDPDVYYSEPADLGENGEPTNQYKYDEGENVPEKRNGQVFMGWYAAEKETVYNSETKEFDETGNWIIRAHWEVDQWADPLVPVGDRPNEWGDGIPDQFQIHVLYYMLNGSFTFDGKAGVRSGGTPGNRGGKAAFGVAASTTVTKRDSEGRPASNGTARFAAEHIPTNVVPDSGYTSIKWYVKDTQEYVDAPVVGAAVPEPESAIYGFGYVIACRSRQNVTVKYIDTGTHISTETYYKGSYFQPLLTDGIAATGQTSIKIWKNESTNTNYYLPITNSYVYTITENMNLTAVYQTGTGISTGVDVKTVSYDWGGIVPSGVTLPGKMNFKGDVSVKVQPGPTNSVKVGSDEYVFLGWKVTSGSIQNQPAGSDYVGSSIKLNRENVVLTAQWAKKQPPAVLVIWKSGGEDDLTLKSENVPAANVIKDSNGKVTEVKADYPPTPTREGFSFDGWTIEDQPDGSVIIRAKWSTCDHDWKQTTAPDCLNKGVETCSKCHETREIKELGHDWGDWKDNGDGTHTQHCKRNDKHVQHENETHKYGAWTPTQNPGEEERTCTECGHRETKTEDQKPEYAVTWKDGDKVIGTGKTEDPTKIPEAPAVPTPPEGKEFDKWGEPVVNEDDKTITIQVVWKDKTTTTTPPIGGGTVIKPDPVPTNPGIDIPDDNPPLANVDGLNTTDHFAYIQGYPDGTVKPMGSLTRAEAATIFYRLMTEEYRVANWTTTNKFSDVKEGSWYNVAISVAANAGILEGYTDGTFKPNKAVTRAEFATMAARFMTENITGENAGDFDDTKGHWAAEDIRKAVEAGWIKGDGGKFRPNEAITRAEVMQLVNNMLDRCFVPDAEHMLSDMKVWSDNPKGTDYYNDVQEATNGHIYKLEDSVETWTELVELDWLEKEAEWIANNGANAKTEK